MGVGDAMDPDFSHRFAVFVVFMGAFWCFSHAAITGDYFREIKYKLPSEYQYVQQINDQFGVEVTVGKSPAFQDRAVGTTGETKVKCTKLSTTEISKIQELEKYKLDILCDADGFERNEYFQNIRQEYWDCKDDKGNTMFRRVVNEVLSVDWIRDVRYYDTIVEITTKHHWTDGRMVQLVDIQYYCDGDNTGKFTTACKYEGELSLEASEAGPYHINKIEPDKLIQEQKGNSKEIKELKYLSVSDDFIFEKTHDIEGVTLEVASSCPVEDFGREEDVYACVKDQGVKPYPFAFRMRSIRKMPTDDKGTTIIDATISEHDYFKYFIPIKEEVWTCKNSKENEPGRLIRVVNEVFTTKVIKNIQAKNTVVFVASEEIIKNVHRYRLNEIKYLDPKTNKVLKYVGSIRLQEEENGKLEPEREIKYVLQSNRLFRNLIGAEGVDLRVGSRYETASFKSSPEQTVTCEKNEDVKYRDEFKTQFKLITSTSKVNDFSTVYSSQKIETHEQKKYFKYKKKEVLVCSNNEDNIKFLRVRNEIELQAPVREIETYDGIEISRPMKNSEQPKKIEIFETKYLDYDKYFVIKYEGKLQMKGNTKSQTTGDELTVEISNPVTISKTEDDIFYIYGRYHGKQPTLKELTYNPSDTGTVINLDIGSSNPMMYFGSIYKNEDTGTANSLASCEIFLHYKVDKLFKSSYAPKCHIQTLVFPGDTDMNQYESRYIAAFYINDQELWYCITQEGNRFLRTVNSFYYLKYHKYSTLKAKELNYTSTTSFSYELVDDDYFMKLEEIAYLTQHMTQGNSLKTFKFQGNIVLRPNSRVTNNEIWKSGSEVIGLGQFTKRVYETNMDVKYELDLEQEQLYKTAINKEGIISLEVGSKWTRTLTTSSVGLSCGKIEDNDQSRFTSEQKAKFTTKVKDTQAKDVYNDYFDLESSEVWLCFDWDKNSNKFKETPSAYRISNQISLKPEKCSEVKDIQYRDGIHLIAGKSNQDPPSHCVEILENKFFNYELTEEVRVGKLSLYKYEDEKYVDLSDSYWKIQPRKLTSISGIKYNEYLLKENQSFKKVIHSDGVTIDFDKPYDTTKQEPLNNPTSVFTCVEFTVSGEQQAYLQPRIAIIIDHEKKQYNPKDLSTTTKFWKCEADGESTVMKVVHSTTCTRLIASIFFHDTVGINDLGIIENIPNIEIEEVLYYNEDFTKLLRFDGFERVPPGSEHSLNKLRVPLYLKEVVHGKIIDRFGTRAYEIGSQWQEVIGNGATNAVCEGRKSQTFDETFGMDIFSRYKLRQVGYFDDNMKYVRQIIYDCYIGKVIEEKTPIDFHRVVNELVLTKTREIFRIYYHDGISIEKQKLLITGALVWKVREVKYFDPSKSKILKYNGKLRIESQINSELLRLLRMPTDLKEYPIELDLESKSNVLASQNYFSFEQLTMYALHRDTKVVMEDKIEYPDDTGSFRKVSTKLINTEKGVDSLLIGSKWVTEYTGTSKCIVDKWNPNNYMQLSTAISFITDDGLQFVLDEETVVDYFKLISLDVWVCVNDAMSFFRVVTKLELKPEMKDNVFAISYFNGVEIKEVNTQRGVITEITERKYLSSSDFTVLKHDGIVQLLDQKSIPPTMHTPKYGKTLYERLCDFIKKIRDSLRR